jgi:hypothetical protein
LTHIQFLFYFVVYTTSWIWFGCQFWHHVVPAPFRSQLWGIEPSSSLPSSASITTELTNNWYKFKYLYILKNNFHIKVGFKFYLVIFFYS